MWIFGYGSLIWKVDFPVAERVPGFIKGFVRRFWQGSHDHRGVPGAPGRVVTLVPFDEWVNMNDDFRDAVDAVTWGVAYRIPDDKIEEVKAHLDFREKDGYSKHIVDVYASLNDVTPVVREAVCFIGTTHNSSFLGYAPLPDLAHHIFHAKGPSGPNEEYLLNLAKATRELAPQAVDHHLFGLESEILRLRKQPHVDCKIPYPLPVTNQDVNEEPEPNEVAAGD